MAGDYFYPIAFNVPIAMAASLVVAYIVTPWAANRFLPLHSAGMQENSMLLFTVVEYHYSRCLYMIKMNAGCCHK